MIRINRNEVQLTGLEQALHAWHASLLDRGLSMVEAFHFIEKRTEPNSPVGAALADPRFRAFLNQEEPPAEEQTTNEMPAEPVRDADGKVTYHPWSDGWGIGFRVVHDDGRKEFVYLYPSTTGDAADDWPNVFVYQGPDGDVTGGNDQPWHHYDVLRPEQSELAKLAAQEDPSVVKRGIGEDWGDAGIERLRQIPG